MPRRTNEFQDLVSLVERAFAPLGARITESAQVMGVDENNLREIDVLVEYGGGDYALRIAVEAKDEIRKMTQDRLEAILGKYRTESGIGAEEVVVVSRKGFSEPAKIRAQQEGISLLTFREATECEWEQKIPTDITLDVAPHVIGYEFEPEISEVENDALIQEGRFVCSECGRDHGPVKLFVRTALSNRRLMENLRKVASQCEGSCLAKVSWRFADAMVLCISGLQYGIESFCIHLHCAYARGSLKITPYEYGDDVIQHLRGEVAGTEVEFILTDGLESENIPTRINHIGSSARIQEGPASAQSIDMSAANPTWFRDWLSKLEPLLDSVSADLTYQEKMYDFCEKVDRVIPACAKFYLGKAAGYLQTGIIAFEDRQQLKGRLSQVKSTADGCDLDQLVCVVPDGRPDKIFSGVDLCTVVDTAVDSETLTRLLPPIGMLCEAVMEFDFSFYTGEQTPLRDIEVDAEIVTIDGTAMSLEQFGHALDKAMREHSAAGLKELRQGGAFYADIDMSFATALPEGTSLVKPNGESFALRFLQGTGSVRGLLAILDEARLVEVDGASLIESFCAETQWPVLRLPTQCRPDISLDYPSPLPEPKRVDSELPPATINRLIPSSLALRRDVEHDAMGRSLRIQKQGETNHWELNVMPLKVFR